ncbi:MAG: hypothetical protein PHX83_12010 [Acidobacteriia bacterium]|nr:hypothetical protein [Terriglobia bacterium]
MSVHNVLKFVSGSTTINLTSNEVLSVEVVTNQRFYTRYLLSGQPLLYYHGEPWHELTVDVIPDERGTVDHVNTLKALTAEIEITLYYLNGDSAGVYNVKIDPNVEIYFDAGSRDAGRLMRLHFWEVLTAKTPAVEITYLPIGRI